MRKLEYEVLEGWEKLPEGWSFVEVAGVATDSSDRVYVFNRGEHPIIVFDADGTFLDAWGEGVFTNAHGIYIGHVVELPPRSQPRLIAISPDSKHAAVSLGATREVALVNLEGRWRVDPGHDSP